MTAAIVATACALGLGYGVALIRHDTNEHAWRIAFIVGQNRVLFTELRALRAHAGLPPLPDTIDQPALPEPAGWLASLREAWADWRHRNDQAPAADTQPEPDPGPDTQPVERAIDQQHQQLTAGRVDDLELARLLADIEDDLRGWRRDMEAA